MNIKIISKICRISVIVLLFLFLLHFIGVSHKAFAANQVLYVTPGGTGDCTSWVNACTLQSALTTAASGNEIWVAAGVYKPTTGTDRNATFQLINGVAVYGGFNGTETVLSERNPAANPTILSGDIDNNDSQTPIVTNARTVTDNTANSLHVVTGATGAILDGFTITAGFADGNAGAGMVNNNSSPTLTNVVFSGNYASIGGGIADGNGSNPTLTNVTFNGNAGNYCSGIFNYSSSPTLTNVTFSNNSADLGGGGMFNQHNSNPILTNVTFSGNGVQLYGGGMFNEDNSNPILTNVTFSGNYASGGGRTNAGVGGGMYNDPSSSPQINDTIFWNNTAFLDGAQIYNEAGSNSIIKDSVIQGGCPTGSTCTNIITTDPMLGSLGNYGGLTQTIPLLAGSSAIDTGNNNTCAVTDQRGITRPQGLHCDIGAFEYVNQTPLDTTAPTLNLPNTLTQNATSAQGATVTYTVTATDPDNQSSDLTISCSPSSGSVFPIGTTKVNCTASDPAGNKSTGSFQIVVVVNDPTDKDQCKKDGWKNFIYPSFKNQGDCVSYVATQGKNPPNGK